jgi:lipid-A-disaccharide synthase
MTTPTVMLVAGEASGDLHAANLVLALKQLNPQVRFMGMGGRRMRAAGVELLVDSSSLAVVGLVEVLAHYPDLLAALKKLRVAVETIRPDLLILVDYPDFNLRLAAFAKQMQVKVLYYISPQLWAWRKGRVNKIRRLVDQMAVIFPFEVPFYEAAHVPVEFTGHPLVDEVKTTLTPPQARLHFGLDPARKVVGLFPGSRKSEIKRLMSVILQSARVLHERFHDLQFILPIAPGLVRHELEAWIEATPTPVTLVENQVYDVIQSCDAIISASGTATLQIGLLETPMVIIYRMSNLTYWIARLLVSVKHVGLVNIVLDRTTVLELIQHEAQPKRIATEIARLLTDETYASNMRRALAEVKHRLGEGGGSQRVAKLANAMLTDRR